MRNGGNATLGNFTNTGTIDPANASVTTLVGTITNSGTMRLNSTDSATQFLISGAVTLQGGETLSLSDQLYLNNQIVATTGTNTLTNAAGSTIQGAGLIGAGGLALVNQGVMWATQAANPLDIQPRAAGMTNTGTLHASDGATLVLSGANGGVVTNTGGTIEAFANSVVQVQEGMTIIGGTLRTKDNGLIRTSRETSGSSTA